MTSTLGETETKIINAAIACIEKYGIQGATNRRIAEVAEVNSAAINYYFRSKENLIQICMQTTLENAFNLDDVPAPQEGGAQAYTTALFSHLIEGGSNYPGVARAHFYDLLTAGDYDAEVVAKLNAFILSLSDRLRSLGAGQNPEELKLACTQITAASMLLSLAPRLFAGQGLDLHDPATRQRFVERLVQRLL